MFDDPVETVSRIGNACANHIAGGQYMTVLDDVARLIKQVSPNAIGDDCISEKLTLTVRQHANIKTRALAGQPGYLRQKARCFSCGSNKKVIVAR